MLFWLQRLRLHLYAFPIGVQLSVEDVFLILDTTAFWNSAVEAHSNFLFCSSVAFEWWIHILWLHIKAVLIFKARDRIQ